MLLASVLTAPASSDATTENVTTATGTPKCLGEPATLVGSAASEKITGSAGKDVIVARGGADTVVAGGGADLICGGRGADVITAGSGRDVVVGGVGSDEVTGGGGSDILIGSAGNDVLRGAGGIDALVGMAGNDRYSGGGGLDLAGFLASGKAVTVKLKAGSGRGEGTDTLAGIEGVIGSAFNDTIVGDSGLNVLLGGGGNDAINGRSGHDLVFYTLASSAIVVNLTADTASGGDGSDSVVSIESAVGSPFDDTLIGSPSYNFLDGAEGVDTAFGKAGDDICRAETASGCLQVLPSSSTPPGEVQSALDGSILRLGREEASPPSADVAVTAPSTLASSGSMGCPVGSGDAIVAFPSVQGYGYYVWRSNHFGSGWTSWNFGPWLYFNGSSWIVHLYGAWYSVDSQTPLGANYVSVPIQAWYYSYTYGQWYYLGQCTTIGVHLIPGLTIVS
jgi:Ca2+-binding RTX toxin-like protein